MVFRAAIFLFIITSLFFHISAQEYCNFNCCYTFDVSIYSSYAYDDKLETKSGRDLVDTTSWTNLVLFGWNQSVCFQPFAGVGAYKLRVIDKVPGTQNSLGDQIQGNMVTQPGIAGMLGVKGLFPCLPCDNFIKYRAHYFIADPKLSYAVIRGSMGTNQRIYLLYQQFDGYLTLGHSFEYGSFYAGPEFIYTNGHFSKKTVILTGNNTYTLSDYRSQNNVGAIAGLEINPCSSAWWLKLETTFVSHYAVNLEFGSSF